MAFIEPKIQIDGKVTEKFFEHVKEIFNQPRWLTSLLIAVILGGMTYFGINYYRDKKDYTELQEQVENISYEVSNQLNISDYKQNLIYIITEIKLFRSSEEQWYQAEIHEIDIMISFLQKYHKYTCSSDVEDLKSLKQRLQINQEIYKQNCDYQLDCLNKIINSDTIK